MADKLTEAAQNEAQTRPPLAGGTGERAEKLAEELNADKIAKAKADLANGTITPETVEKLAKKIRSL